VLKKLYAKEIGENFQDKEYPEEYVQENPGSVRPRPFTVPRARSTKITCCYCREPHYINLQIEALDIDRCISPLPHQHPRLPGCVRCDRTRIDVGTTNPMKGLIGRKVTLVKDTDQGPVAELSKLTDRFRNLCSLYVNTANEKIKETQEVVVNSNKELSEVYQNHIDLVEKENAELKKKLEKTEELRIMLETCQDKLEKEQRNSDKLISFIRTTMTTALFATDPTAQEEMEVDGLTAAVLSDCEEVSISPEDTTAEKKHKILQQIMYKSYEIITPDRKRSIQDLTSSESEYDSDYSQLAELREIKRIRRLKSPSFSPGAEYDAEAEDSTD